MEIWVWWRGGGMFDRKRMHLSHNDHSPDKFQRSLRLPISWFQKKLRLRNHAKLRVFGNRRTLLRVGLSHLLDGSRVEASCQMQEELLRGPAQTGDIILWLQSAIIAKYAVFGRHSKLSGSNWWEAWHRHPNSEFLRMHFHYLFSAGVAHDFGSDFDVAYLFPRHLLLR